MHPKKGERREIVQTNVRFHRKNESEVYATRSMIMNKSQLVMLVLYKKVKKMINKLITASFMFLSAASFGHPASIEYVAQELEKMRSEFNTRLTMTNTAIQQKINSLPLVTHQIGEIFQGGMVFYVDATQQHGLIVSLVDVGEPLEWRNGDGGDRITNAHGQGLGSGETNTRLVISEQTIDQQDGDFAALRAANYAVLTDGITPCSEHFAPNKICYGGWYLPSSYELILLHNAIKKLGETGFSSNAYWSSTEWNTTQAVSVDFTNGEPQIQDKFIPSSIRAIHNF